MNGTLFLAGRWLMAALFLVAGIRKILMFSGQVGYFTKLGFPMPEVMTVLAIVIEVGGGILLVVGWKTRHVAWLLSLFVLIATFAAHRFWEFDAAAYAGQLNNFLKNLAIIGGLFFLAAAGPGRMSADKA
jgi:putative oxidoreductase